jgi:hypothetical protein
MQDTQTHNGWLTSLGLFGAWIVTSAGALIDALYIRGAMLSILRTLQVVDLQIYHKQGNQGLNFQFGYGLTLFDDLLLLVLGCAVIAAVILTENYFRKGRALGQLWKRVGKVLIVEIAIFVLTALIVTYV